MVEFMNEALFVVKRQMGAGKTRPSFDHESANSRRLIKMEKNSLFFHCNAVMRDFKIWAAQCALLNLLTKIGYACYFRQ